MGKDHARIARNLRRTAAVFFVLATLFAVFGIVALIVTGEPTSLITIVGAVNVAISGVSLRNTARTRDTLAATNH